MLRLNVVFLALLLPTFCFAKPIDNLMVSNNSGSLISFEGSQRECIGQTDPHTIRQISHDDFEKLCLGTRCQIAVFSDDSCKYDLGYFTFDPYGGVSNFHIYYPSYIFEGNQNYIFINWR
jgi:hypothetical protein